MTQRDAQIHKQVRLKTLLFLSESKTTVFKVNVSCIIVTTKYFTLKIALRSLNIYACVKFIILKFKCFISKSIKTVIIEVD